ncbi:pectin lyase [Geosmithia morbida]|uniref:pectin lyase n=1 Tax=Geosmithia morbida TaxID=1094350 RepID=A0A9P4Z0B1_9HYPO|nr:pectin lyase [Geosmithia morbida]KAF4126195.1 pectin lyase [Geosmithia morbida]
MGLVSTLFTAATLASSASALAIRATPTVEGFATGVTGGAGGSTVTPTTAEELVSYLEDDQARVVYVNQHFDLRNYDGTTSGSGCAPWGTDTGCQLAINKDDWCTNYQPDAPTVSSITYYEAGLNPIEVASDKSIIGVGSSGIIEGKGLRLANGVKNVIIQNIHVTNLNPQYVWGGDAITLAGTDLVWIDHVKTSLIGRQHLVFGESASGRVTVSNCEFDGVTSWSATCDGRHYWTNYFTGSDDQITFKNNYIHDVSGRAPKVGGNTVLHAVNNYWYNAAHGFEIGSGGYVLVEGSVFQNVDAPEDTGSTRAGELYSVVGASAASACSSNLGRSCQANAFGSSGTLDGEDSGVLSKFSGLSNIASASTAEVAKDVVNTAGFGKI